MLYDIPQNAESFNPRLIDPALLTYNEWLKIVDSDNKFHPDSAYQTDVKKLNQFPNDKKDAYPKLVKRIRLKGLVFEIRLGNEKRKICKRTSDGEYERIDGQLQYYTDEEIQRLGHHLYDWTLSVFHNDVRVGSVQDEWGCMLVMVADEYRSFGLGTLLLKIGYGIEPDKPSGGFTNAGKNTFARVHAEFVRDALKFGIYTKMVKDGRISIARVKQIINSAIKTKPNISDINLDSSNPKDWLLYVGNNDFIIYDKKLKNLDTDNPKYNYFADSMIKGLVHIVDNNNRAFLHNFGADSIGLRRFLISCAVEYCNNQNIELYLEKDEPKYLSSDFGEVAEITNTIGFSAQKIIPTGKRIDYNSIGKVEQKWRKSFDRYDEFYYRMIEIAYSKYE